MFLAMMLTMVLFQRRHLITLSSFVGRKIVERYNLHSMVEKASAESISIEEQQNDSMTCNKPIYKVALSTGQMIRAHHVVLALGPQRVRNYPGPFRDINYSTQAEHSVSKSCLPLVHSLDLLRPGSHDEWAKLLQCLEDKNTPARILVIGGGLTSAHLVLKLHRHFNDAGKELQQTLISRRKFHIQPFDLDLSWMGRTRGHKLAQFWSERDFECRAKRMKDAKNGGSSITPEVFQQLIQLQNQRHLVLREHLEVADAEYLEQQHQWQVYFQDSPLAHDEGSNDANSSDISTYDYIICATGTSTSLTDEPLLSPFLSQMEFTASTNQAKLTPDLRVAGGQNVFVLGDAAALQLGPGAVNLMGARAGAARVARAVRKSLDVAN
mmetsp:Transcript_35526/g.64682  ORF Transcript_35526/g.64682 Transcript_35526/m.64682 type:complete len:381 (+) Transcript_35526:200-1342(+)